MTGEAPATATGDGAAAEGSMPADTYVPMPRGPSDPPADDPLSLLEPGPSRSAAQAASRAPAASRAAAHSTPGAGRQRIVAAPGIPAEWLEQCLDGCPGVQFVGDEPPLDNAALDGVAGVLTGCTVAIAETGTIVLDHGPGQGRRAISLVPDFHLVVVASGQVAADLADALAGLDPARPHTFISGPSATSDIELVRVEGVHGPRHLHVLIAD
ncbi:MAG TPA: LUD domain-containing protein [Streptosporangiaceae bacterium]|nr:LUD domain-containing protein [Streptosporangiaceae bacterium]